MTVSSTNSSQTFACDGATQTFTCDFTVLSGPEMQAYLITISSGVVAELTNGVDFTVGGIGTANAIVLTTLAYSNLYQLRCKRKTTRLQETDYRDNDPFPAEAHERALDRLTMIALEDEAALERTIRVPDGETLALLPSAAARALTILGFDAAGNLVVSIPSSGSAAALALLLASSSSNVQGLGMTGFAWNLLFAAGTGGWAVRTASSAYNILRDIPVTEWAAIQNYTSTYDCTSAIQTAINALAATGGNLFIPGGQYRFTALEILALVAVEGEGYDSTNLIYTPTAGHGLRCAGTALSPRIKIHLKGFSCYALTTSSGAGLNAAYFSDCLVQDVRFRNFANDVQIEQSWNTDFVRVKAETASNDGFNIGLEANSINFYSCSVSGAVRAGAYLRGCRSVNFYGFNPEGCSQNIQVVAQAGYQTSSVNFFGGYSEGATSYEALIESLDAGVTMPRNVNFWGVKFQALVDNLRQAIRISHAKGVKVDGCTFNDISGIRFAYAVYMPAGGAAEDVVIGENVDRSVNGYYNDVGQLFTRVGRNPIITANQAQWIAGVISEEITLSTVGLTTNSVADLLPANSIIEAVVARVTTTITLTTNWALGDPTTAARFNPASASLAAGTNSVGLTHVDQTGAAGPKQVAAAKLRITCTGANPGAGKIRVTVFYRQFAAPTS